MTTETLTAEPTTPPAAAKPARPPRFAVVELMGHRRFGARVVKTTLCGEPVLKCVILCEPPITQIVRPASLYALTYCTEDQARRVNTSYALRDAVPCLPEGTRGAGDRTVDVTPDDDTPGWGDH